MALFSRKKKKKDGDRRDMKWDNEWNIAAEEGREVIQQWRKKRLRTLASRSPYPEFLIYTFSLDTLKSFFQNINFMVVIQMIIAITAVYICEVFDISFDIHVSLFVSPIVFPLAFSINTDFQRREKVLEDLALFKSSGLVWYFCMREWKQAAELDNTWMTAVHYKLKSLLFHLEEYLLTDRIDHRKVILRAMYEDFSDTNQIIEQVRASKLPANTAIVSRSLHLFNMMCLAFERLRVIREYRSPRSIRSFNKVFIMFLPVLISPYFVHQRKKGNNVWEPYYVAAMVSFVFSVLQGVQDKLDDPFDGMSEDDINLNTIDEWTIASLEHTLKRSFDVGRFKVTVDPKKDPIDGLSPTPVRGMDTPKVPTGFVTPAFRRGSASVPRDEGVDYNKLAGLLEGLPGNLTIRRKSLKDKDENVQKLASYLDGVAGDTRISWKRHSNIDYSPSPYASNESLHQEQVFIRPNVSDIFEEQQNGHTPDHPVSVETNIDKDVDEKDNTVVNFQDSGHENDRDTSSFKNEKIDYRKHALLRANYEKLGVEPSMKQDVCKVAQNENKPISFSVQPVTDNAIEKKEDYKNPSDDNLNIKIEKPGSLLNGLAGCTRFLLKTAQNCDIASPLCTDENIRYERVSPSSRKRFKSQQGDHAPATFLADTAIDSEVNSKTIPQKVVSIKNDSLASSIKGLPGCTRFKVKNEIALHHPVLKNETAPQDNTKSVSFSVQPAIDIVIDTDNDCKTPMINEEDDCDDYHLRPLFHFGSTNNIANNNMGEIKEKV